MKLLTVEGGRVSKEKATANVGIVVGAIFAVLGVLGLVKPEDTSAVVEQAQNVTAQVIEAIGGSAVLFSSLQTLWRRDREDS